MCRPGRRAMIRHNHQHRHPPSEPSLREPSFQHPSGNALAASVPAANRSRHELLPRLVRCFRVPHLLLPLPRRRMPASTHAHARVTSLAHQSCCLRPRLTSVIGPPPLSPCREIICTKSSDQSPTPADLPRRTHTHGASHTSSLGSA